MKISIQVPRKYFKYSKKYSDYYFLLAHWVKEEDMDLFQEKEIYLDNGAYELGEAIEFEKYKRVIDMVQPKVIILPDVRFDARKTVVMSNAFLDKYYKPWNFYMGAIQGRTWEEWNYCFKEFVNSRRIDVLGITDVPICYHPLSKKYGKDSVAFSRVYALERLEKKGWLSWVGRPIHILGSIDPIELKYLRQYSEVVSTDSKIAFWNGVYFDKLNYMKGLTSAIKYEGMTWGWDGKLSFKQKHIIKHNIMVFKSLARRSNNNG